MLPPVDAAGALGVDGVLGAGVLAGALLSPLAAGLLDESDEAEDAAKKLTDEQKAAIRKRFNLDAEPPAPGPFPEPPAGKVPYTKADGTVVYVTPAQARRYAEAKRDARRARERAEKAGTE